MRPLSYLPMLAAAMLVAAPGVASASGKDREARGEAELAKILEGRVAGEAVRCIGTSDRRNLQIIDGTALVFGSGRTIYVNKPDGVRFLDQFDVPVFTLFGSQLCKLDQVELRDRSSSIPGPRLTMGEFIPYHREKAENAD